MKEYTLERDLTSANIATNGSPSQMIASYMNDLTPERNLLCAITLHISNMN